MVMDKWVPYNHTIIIKHLLCVLLLLWIWFIYLPQISQSLNTSVSIYINGEMVKRESFRLQWRKTEQRENSQQPDPSRLEESSRLNTVMSNNRITFRYFCQYSCEKLNVSPVKLQTIKIPKHRGMKANLWHPVLSLPWAVLIWTHYDIEIPFTYLFILQVHLLVDWSHKGAKTVESLYSKINIFKLN